MALQDEYKQKIEALHPFKSKLSEWEYGFIGDILRKNFSASEKQAGIVNKIWNKYVNGVEEPKTQRASSSVPDVTEVGTGFWKAYKQEGGWQIYHQQLLIGQKIDYRAAEVITKFLNDNEQWIGIIPAEGDPEQELTPF